MVKTEQAIKLKKFDTIICIDGEKTVDFLEIHKDSNILIINYMDKTRTFALQNELILFERHFNSVLHKSFIPDINYFYK